MLAEAKSEIADRGITDVVARDTAFPYDIPNIRSVPRLTPA